MKRMRKIAIALCSFALVAMIGMPFILHITQNMFMAKAETKQTNVYDEEFFSNANTYDAILTEVDVRGGLSAFYFFGYDEASITQCLLVSEHVYAIRERVRYLCEIIENFEEGTPLSEEDYYSWTFNTLDKWSELEYTMEDSSVQEGYLNYWRELGYTINDNAWNHYRDYVWIGNTSAATGYDYNNIYYLEMGTVLLEI